jgi:hypothetical protein
LAVAAYTGARRGETLALRWSDFDAEAKTLRIERALEDTKSQGIRLKGPKTERGERTIAIDDGLVSLLRAEREKHLRVTAGIPDGAVANLSLVKLADGVLIFPSPAGSDLDLTRPRRPRNVTKEFARHSAKLGFAGLRFHDLRGTHETLLLDAGVPVHVVAARCGHDPAVLLRSYARRPGRPIPAPRPSSAACLGLCLAAHNLYSEKEWISEKEHKRGLTMLTDGYDLTKDETATIIRRWQDGVLRSIARVWLQEFDFIRAELSLPEIEQEKFARDNMAVFQRLFNSKHDKGDFDTKEGDVPRVSIDGDEFIRALQHR